MVGLYGSINVVHQPNMGTTECSSLPCIHSLSAPPQVSEFPNDGVHKNWKCVSEEGTVVLHTSLLEGRLLGENLKSVANGSSCDSHTEQTLEICM